MKKQHKVSILAAALILAMPVGAAFADPPAHAKGGKGNAKNKAPHATVIKREVRREPRINVAGNCPPGLAKKNPPCVPPGQAKKGRGGISIGDIINWDLAHAVTRPGLYGLSNPPSGNRYAIVDGRLVRVNRDNGKILSILRVVDAILD